MRFAVSGLPSSSYCTCSYSACAAPCAMPPCCWPATSSGLRMRPQSSTAMWRSSSTRPVSVSTSTTATCAPNGKRRLALVEVELVREPGLHAVGPTRTRRSPPRRARPTNGGWRARRRPRAPSSPTTMSSALASSRCAASVRALSSTTLARLVHARYPRSAASASPSCPARAGSPRCRTARARTLSIGTPSTLAHDHRERGLVALAVRARADRRGHGAVVVHLDRAVLDEQTAAR